MGMAALLGAGVHGARSRVYDNAGARLNYSDSLQSGWLRMILSALLRCGRASAYLPSSETLPPREVFLLILDALREISSEHHYQPVKR
jgi:hypothetical protein